MLLHVILGNFCVDDFLCGYQPVDEAKQLVSDLNHAVTKGDFPLRNAF